MAPVTGSGDMRLQRKADIKPTIATRRSAIRTDEGQAELVRRWLAGESEDEIGKSLGYERKLGRPIHDAILRFVNNQLSERREWYQRMRYDQDAAREALTRYATH
jgi:hypothetical protein